MISVFSRRFNHIDKKHVNICLKSNWISSNGPYSKKLSKKIKSLFDANVSFVSSGTAAIECALNAVNVKKGDEVIIPSFTIVSCLNTVLRLGAKPVIIDVNKKTWLPNEEDIVKKINKKTKAILVVHSFGNCVNVFKLKKLINNKRIKIIEDCAEAFGAKIGNVLAGTMGDISTFSFYANKTITAGEGGMVITKNKGFFLKVEKYKNLFFGKKERFNHEEIGFNYRMTDLQAALAFSQFLQYKKNIDIMKKNIRIYKKFLNTENIEFQKINTKCKNVWWMFAFVLKKHKASDLINYLKKNNIDSRNLFKPLDTMKFYKKKTGIRSKNSEYLYKQGLYIPSGYDLSISQIKKVCKICNNFFKKN